MGDRSLLVELGNGIDPETNQQVKSLQMALEQQEPEGILDLAPTYRSLMVVIDPRMLSLARLKQRIEQLLQDPQLSTPADSKLYRIPVVYGGVYGPDLDWVARYHRISPTDVVALHTGPAYRVYMIGFTPGYPYMAELPEGLDTPRKETPRTAVPRGSVGIAQRQTGVYPVESPGGWQIIGRTPLTLFDASQWPPALLETGDQVQFFPIQEQEQDRWRT
jgi:KipI family sensor histidine kinase inhibitor